MSICSLDSLVFSIFSENIGNAILTCINSSLLGMVAL